MSGVNHDVVTLADASGTAEELARELLRQGSRLVTAESCTGGGIAYVLTSIPGSSNWFERGFITYSNASKREILQIGAEILDRHGAVSEPVVVAMAEAALARSRADYSIAVTGIAGPDGGSKEKPVGTVWFGWSRGAGQTRTLTHCFEGDRRAVREQTIAFAIEGLLTWIRSDPKGRGSAS